MFRGNRNRGYVCSLQKIKHEILDTDTISDSEPSFRAQPKSSPFLSLDANCLSTCSLHKMDPCCIDTYRKTRFSFCLVFCRIAKTFLIWLFKQDTELLVIIDFHLEFIVIVFLSFCLGYAVFWINLITYAIKEGYKYFIETFNI